MSDLKHMVDKAEKFYATRDPRSLIPHEFWQSFRRIEEYAPATVGFIRDKGVMHPFTDEAVNSLIEQGKNQNDRFILMVEDLVREAVLNSLLRHASLVVGIEYASQGVTTSNREDFELHNARNTATLKKHLLCQLDFVRAIVVGDDAETFAAWTKEAEDHADKPEGLEARYKRMRLGEARSKAPKSAAAKILELLRQSDEFPWITCGEDHPEGKCEPCKVMTGYQNGGLSEIETVRQLVVLRHEELGEDFDATKELKKFWKVITLAGQTKNTGAEKWAAIDQEAFYQGANRAGWAVIWKDDGNGKPTVDFAIPAASPGESGVSGGATSERQQNEADGEVTLGHAHGSDDPAAKADDFNDPAN